MYKEINLKSNTQEKIITEILFELAVARADGIQIVKLNIPDCDNEDEFCPIERKMQGIVKLFKNMKRKNMIQLYSTPESFLFQTTEAVFLLNKYPSLSAVVASNSDFWFIIKL